MKKILLICAAGMSTSMLVKKMQEASKEMGIETEIRAVGDAESAEIIKLFDIVLLGPQVRFILNKTQAAAGDIPVRVIDMMLYGTMNGKEVLKEALKVIEGKK